MGFSEQKNKIIQDLVAKKKEKEKDLTKAATTKTVSEKALASITSISDNDKSDLANAENNQNAYSLAKDSALNLLKDIDLSHKGSQTLHKEVLKMMEDAYQTALKAASFASVIDELNTHINNEVKHNKVILNLLVKDSAKAVLDAKTAVSLATKALVDSITAVGSVIRLSNSLNDTKTLIDNTLPLINDKSTGLDSLLEKLKADSQKLYDQSLKDKKTAELALRNVIKRFNDATTEADAAAKALDAANAAVGQTA